MIFIYLLKLNRRARCILLIFILEEFLKEIEVISDAFAAFNLSGIFPPKDRVGLYLSFTKRICKRK